MEQSQLPLWGVGAVVGVILFYLYKKWAAGGVCSYKADLRGKVVIVTGANTGIGYYTAKSLAEMGAHVILACRDEKRGQGAVDRITEALPDTKDRVEYMHLDLASLDSIRAFAKNYEAKGFACLNVLINNAGVGWSPRAETYDGFEMQFGVNYLGHFLLTLLLLEELKKANASRVINLSSRASETESMADIYWDDLQSVRHYDRFKVYGQSKLANVIFTEELNRRLKGTAVTTYSVHPGAIKTELARHLPWMFRFILAGPGTALLPIKTAWQGAQTTLYTAIAPGIEQYSGKYFADCKVKKHPHPLVGDKEAAARLWKKSEDLVRCRFE